MDKEELHQALIFEIKKQVEELLAADNISEVEKEKLIRQALEVIEDGKSGVIR